MTALLLAASAAYAPARGRLAARSLVVALLLLLIPAADIAIALAQRVIAWAIPPRRLPRLDFSDRRSRRRPHDGRRADAADERRRGGGAARAHRGARARQPRSAHPLRDPQRFRRRRSRGAAGRRGRFSPPRAPASRISIGGSAPSTPIASSCSIASGAGMLGEHVVDGLGAQARQDRGVQPAAARRDRHELHRPGRRAGASSRRCATASRSTTDTRLPRDAAKAAHRHHRASAEPAALRRARSAASPRATGFCSRASASRWRARPDRCSPAPTPATPASTRTRPRSPTSIRISSTKASSPARASTTSTRSCAALDGPRAGERAAVARPLRGALRAHGARHRRRGRRRLSVERPRARADASTAGCAATGRFCGGSFRSCRPARVCSAIACRSSSRWKILDNLRRSLMAPATVALLLLGWTVLPGSPVAWTAIGLAALALPVCLRLLQLLGGPTRLESGPAFLRTAHRRSRDRRRPRLVAAGVPRESGLRDAARDHRDARAARDHEAPAARVGDGRGQRPAVAGRRA